MSLAKVTLMGNVGKDPEVFTFNGRNGSSEGIKFSIGVNQGKGEAQTTSWFECSAFGGLVKPIRDYVTKGKQVLVVGDLKIRKWEKDGKNGVAVEVNVSDLKFTGSNPNAGTGDNNGGGGNRSTSSNGNGNGGGNSRQSAPRQQQAAPVAAGGGGGEISDDDCPF
jgi:single-strand DNA-binding protein